MNSGISSTELGELVHHDYEVWWRQLWCAAFQIDEVVGLMLREQPFPALHLGIQRNEGALAQLGVKVANHIKDMRKGSAWGKRGTPPCNR